MKTTISKSRIKNRMKNLSVFSYDYLGLPFIIKIVRLWRLKA